MFHGFRPSPRITNNGVNCVNRFRHWTSRAVGLLLGGLRRLTANWAPYVESPMPQAEVNALMQQASVPSFGFFFMLALASAIATFGMLANSAPAIIGAMIIAPFMGPIMSLAFGAVGFDRSLIVRSAVTVAAGTALVVIFAYAATFVFGIRLTGSEILGRTAPTLLDLGVAVAAGAAAAFAYTRRSIMNSIAGVAIAVALVPPLTVCGIGLAVGREISAEVGFSMTEFGLYSGGSDIANGAFMLFLTNLIGIVAVAIVVFSLQRYGHWRQALIGLVLALTLSAFLIQPLGRALYKLYVKSAALNVIASLAANAPDTLAARGRIDTINVVYRGDQLFIHIDAISPSTTVDEMQMRADQFRQLLSAILEEPVNVELDVVVVELLNIESHSTDSAAGMSDARTGNDRTVPETAD